ncbi:peptidylprolyl isomerase [Pseudodesulfovibrio indicus]|uniref:Peptidyl-prolyl cis-trans isomerase n=1 Tax=Pseudodesulfovibrio indicus TaxID=1716143 RepID=A0A140D9C0_9BACT|nr:peptidylprolyl isomerase [Pseudodesulfovibrio indicus]AMK09787.1 peptidylprolyl isomerase [Pseudodesulfovibrio indicus]TDT86251.1 peptidyl-prolyl cis-trans isomerase A (cyclophilin A)/peptidyl-prolyl cis-trans isomerase B (cyclophilin B) [Pseudodesulfovibrio indicus]
MKRLSLALSALVLALGLFLTLAPTAQAGPNPVVVMETSMGRIMIMLYPADAPKTVANFLKYVEAGFYDNTIFHRVIRQRKRGGEDDTAMNIVQGGGYTFPAKRKSPLYPPIPNEASTGLMNTKGTISMARTDVPDSATSEFFFNVEDNPPFDYRQSAAVVGAGTFSSSVSAGYCAFGKVIRGMDVIEKISEVRTARSGLMQDVPVDPVFIKKAYKAN